MGHSHPRRFTRRRGGCMVFSFPSQGLRGEQHLLTRFQALEKRFEALEAAVSRWELGVAGGESPPTGDMLGLLEGLLGRRQASMEERLRSDMTGHLQVRGAGWCRHGDAVGWVLMCPSLPCPAG